MALLTLVLAGQPALARDAASALPPGTPHWSEVVWYEVFVRSFQDSDGDGIGDLRGLIERLPYLSGLGVGGLWLMPIYPSPSYHGYDVTDYTGVNPEYGDEADLVELVERAHELGIRVIL
ncbi:MAG TPA: alpha-amylase family glycosyl hydrolase, partial [Trueperaceae bacterium]|nr:alpha-amylase family glycosyl hydrolase [Trueperaceae bacterium]